MTEIHLTKQAAAQRQLDAAIRILFAGEDDLAIHTLVSAAHTVVADLDKKKGSHSDRVFAETLQEMRDRFPGVLPGPDVRSFRVWMKQDNRRGANFLKHAGKDAAKALNPSTLSTDHLLLQACSMYTDMGFSATREMRAFGGLPERTRRQNPDRFWQCKRLRSNRPT